MDFIKKKDSEVNKGDVYYIEYNKYNGYIEQFLSDNEMIISKESNNIVFKLSSLEKLDKFLDFSLIENFIYDLGSQILYLKEQNLGIYYIGLSDIVIINNRHFLFINYDVIFPLSSKDNMKISKKISESVGKSASESESESVGGRGDLGVIKNKIFLSSEIITLDKYPSDIYYTSAFYSFATLILYIFDVRLDTLYYNKVYFFLKRCLEKNPKNRSFIYL